MSTGTAQLIAVVVVALIFDLLNGFHDGCNAVSTVIYTKAPKPRFAIGLSSLFNFIGPLIIGVAVAKTIGGIINSEDATAHLVNSKRFFMLLVAKVRTFNRRKQTVIEIRDSGCGIPGEILAKIFDPFYTTKDIGKGIGLGLSISYSIVENHGGKIEVESEKGKGSLFRVVLP